ncbi:MAG: FHA domain-containing protein, partial [Candidatus Lutacidiplasmatales archaeon]
MVPFARGELSIGRQEGNAVRLEARNVSRRHARLVRSNGTVMVEDLGSFNGVHVNGEAIQGKVAVHEGDQIVIGDYRLAIEPGDLSSETPSSEHRPTPVDASGRNTRTAVIQAPPQTARSPRSIPLRPTERPFLIPVDGGDPLEVLGSEVILGRDSGESDLVLDHRSISRRHARLWLDLDGSWHISDLNSINGLRVNGESYRESPLRPGDEVELGHVRLRFQAPGEPRPASGIHLSRMRLAGLLPRWTWIAGLVILLAAVETLRWSGSLSRMAAPYFGTS